MKVTPRDIELLREWFCDIAEKNYGVPYFYGGKNPMTGEDCSQLVVNCLRCVGVLKQWEDLSAQGLWDRFSARFPKNISSTIPQRGALAFWFKKEEVVHVAICLDHLTTIQAARGRKWIDTEKEAKEYSAYVDYKRVDDDNRPVRFIYIWDPMYF